MTIITAILHSMPGLLAQAQSSIPATLPQGVDYLRILP